MLKLLKRIHQSWMIEIKTNLLSICISRGHEAPRANKYSTHTDWNFRLKYHEYIRTLVHGLYNQSSVILESYHECVCKTQLICSSFNLVADTSLCSKNTVRPLSIIAVVNNHFRPSTQDCWLKNKPNGASGKSGLQTVNSINLNCFLLKHSMWGLWQGSFLN